MKKVITTLSVLMGIFVIVGLLLPTQFKVERSIVIELTSAEIHPYVEDLEQWPLWAPWQESDPTIKTTLGSITKGVGASQSWFGDSGSGELKLTKSNMVSGIEYDLSFGGDTSSYTAGISYSAQGQQTQVIWYMEGDMNPPVIGGYFAFLMDTFVGDMFYQGLVNLKAVSENKQ